MPDHAETLKSMLYDIIADRQEQGAVTMHDYFVSKSREVAGLSVPQSQVPDEDENEDEDELS